MTLTRENFASDEDYEAYKADLDRARKQASDTAYKNAEKDAAAAREAAIAEAVEAERRRIEMDEHERLEADRAALAEREAALAQERRGLTATKKLAAAGFDDEAINALLPMFTSLDDKILDGAVESFITTNQNFVKAQVDAAKESLLGATPPSGNPAPPVDMNTQAQQFIESGDAVAAAELLLKDAGLV